MSEVIVLGNLSVIDIVLPCILRESTRIYIVLVHFIVQLLPLSDEHKLP